MELNMNHVWFIIIIPQFWIKGTSSYLLQPQRNKVSQGVFNYFSFLFTGASSNQTQGVFQTPSEVLWNINDEVKLTCKHNISNYDTIFWYYHSVGDLKVSWSYKLLKSSHC